MKINKKKEEVKEEVVEVKEPKKVIPCISKLDMTFQNEDMNKVVEKINKIIEILCQ